MAQKKGKLEIPPPGTRGAWTPFGGFLLRLFRPFLDRAVADYRKSTSPTPPTPRYLDFPTVLLTTVSARTGHEHTSVLGGFAEGADAWVVVASKGGSATNPHWYVNMALSPDRVWLEVGNRRMKVHPELLKGSEREAALDRVAAISPRYGEYQKKTDREIPVVRLTREPIEERPLRQTG
jgi:deazaflavin-dependent oxidoreductase (nitroreductase family)